MFCAAVGCLRAVFGRWLLGWRMAALAGLVAMGLLVGGGSASTLQLFSQVSGSPFATGIAPASVGFSSGGRLLATANGDSTVWVVRVRAKGALSQVPGSPFASGGADELSVAFSPGRRLLATANGFDNTVSVFRV